MTVFSYRAAKRGGGIESGELEARSRADAIIQLERQKLQPVSVSERGQPQARAGTAARAASSGRDGAAGRSGAEGEGAAAAGGAPVRLSRQQVILFTEELKIGRASCRERVSFTV